MDPITTLSTTKTIFSEFWLLFWFFITVMWLLAYYVPKMIASYTANTKETQEKHALNIKEIQEKYNENLKELMKENRLINKELSDTNKEIHKSFIDQLKNIEKDHIKQNHVLDLIHEDIKDIKRQTKTKRKYSDEDEV